mmetsp:Transcript_14870/g.21449  ORF Transcript_14870/g.21449 Transcript_14870/m.21449 type:complete len:242 (-) Transcript_14870:440-1165(-)
MAANNFYSIPIPASAPLANVNAANNSHDAAGIAVGAPRQLADLTNALRETRTRQELKENKPPNLTAVTSDEITSSKLRSHTVATELMVGQNDGLLGAGAPLWAITMAANQHENQQANQLALQALTANQQENQLALQALKAMILNERSRRLNMASPHTIIALRKENQGWGDQLPGGFGNVPAYPAHALGQQCPFYPANYVELTGLSNVDLGNLSIYFNDDFGIVAGDNLAARRAKFRRFTSN